MSVSSNGQVRSPQQLARQGGYVMEMQRRRLLLAMGEVLADVGLEGASIGRICGRAGVSRRTFYEIFEDRDECLLASFDAAVERMTQPVLVAWRGEGDWRSRTRNALIVVLEQLDAQPEVARMCVVETLKAGPAVGARRASVQAALVTAVEEGRSESGSPDEPPPLTGQGVIGGVVSVVHARLLAAAPVSSGRARAGKPQSDAREPLVDLVGQLMAMIVHPYLGSEAARRELDQPAHVVARSVSSVTRDPFRDVSIRFTYRTARVLASIAELPGASNRQVSDAAGIRDEGQTSRLLSRLHHAGLIENDRSSGARGERNVWTLTDRGREIHTTLAG